MTIQEKAIEQLERISHNLGSIGETVDYTDIAIQALEQQSSKDALYEKGFEAGKHYIVDKLCALLEKEGIDSYKVESEVQ